MPQIVFFSVEACEQLWFICFCLFNINPKYWYVAVETKLNKKVLVRERKRHTDRGVSSTTRWGTDKQSETITSRLVLRMRSVKIVYLVMTYFSSRFNLDC